MRTLLVRLDTNNYCNIKCIMCYYGQVKPEKRIIMNIDNYRKFARSIFTRTRFLYLSCGTEPLCTPDFIEYIKIAGKYGIPFISFATNGMLLNEKLQKQLIENRVNEVIFSIDSPVRENYEKIRVGAKYDRLIGVLESFNRIKKAHNAEMPVLRANYTVMSENAGEIEEFIRFAHKYAFKTVSFRHVYKFTGTTYKDRDIRNYQDKYNTQIQKAKLLAKKYGINLDLEPDVISRDCLYPWFTLIVHADGNIYPCADWKDETFFQYKIRDIGSYFKSLELENLKTLLRKGKKSEYCSNCITKRA